MTRRRLVVRQLAHSYGIAILRITYAGVMSQISIFLKIFANGTSGSDLRCALNSQNSPTLGIFSSPRNLAKQLQAGSGLFRGFIIYTLYAPCTWPRALRVAAGAGAFCSQQQVWARCTRGGRSIWRLLLSGSGVERSLIAFANCTPEMSISKLNAFFLGIFSWLRYSCYHSLVSPQRCSACRSPLWFGIPQKHHK